jgi:hypothetical protein
MEILNHIKRLCVVVEYSVNFTMLLKQCFLVFLLAAVSVDAATVTLNGTCSPPTVQFLNQSFGASDIVGSVSFDRSCNVSLIPSISLVMSSVYYFPGILFATFPNLQYCIASSNLNIREIRPNTFLNAKKLFYLNFAPTNFGNFAAYSFAGASSLSALFITASNSTVDVNAFGKLPELGTLTVRDTIMSVIGKTSFIDSTKLGALDLMSNSIRSIDPNAFGTLKNLQQLNLGKNLLISVDKNLLQNNTKLRSISLSDNQLSALDDTFFKNNPYMDNIVLASNLFENINGSLLANTPALKYLQLQNNKLVSLSSTMFQNVPLLVYLESSFNMLTSLPKNIFSGNARLVTIWLNNNKLNAIEKTTFSNMTNLTTLLLSNNVCINTDFRSRTPINATLIMDALAKCDANANNNCAGSGIKDQLKTVITMINSTVTVWANVSSILTSIFNTL